jgi:hypothetical protein
MQNDVQKHKNCVKLYILVNSLIAMFLFNVNKSKKKLTKIFINHNLYWPITDKHKYKPTAINVIGRIKEYLANLWAKVHVN